MGFTITWNGARAAGPWGTFRVFGRVIVSFIPGNYSAQKTEKQLDRILRELVPIL
jgi:hypothetical protein